MVVEAKEIAINEMVLQRCRSSLFKSSLRFAFHHNVILKPDHKDKV
jgi:hypothetical protein